MESLCERPTGSTAAFVRQQALAESSSILLKPNFGYDLPAPGATTLPAVLEAVVEFFVGHGVEVTITEADQVLVDVEKAARAAGVPALCSKSRPRQALSHSSWSL